MPIDPDSVHPIEYRYGCEELRKILSVENMYKTMALVEYYIVKTQEKYGLIPQGVSKALKKAIDNLRVEDIFDEEKRVRHDIMALINVLARNMGELGEYIHIGLTSADLRDTAKILIIKDALAHVEEKLAGLIRVLVDLASKYLNLPCVARTHGMHACVYVFGRKFAVFADEFLRHIERLEELKKRLFVGRISGSVGIHDCLGELGEKIEREVLRELGLEVDENATQVISRDRFAELFSVLTLISTSLDKLATEIRNLQRTEISEVEEEFLPSQVGSTAMPHKKNPINAENICSLSRILRGLLVSAFENVVLWHERDLTNSASERILIPEFFMIVDEQLSRMIRILKRLKVNEENIRKNIELSRGMIYSDILVARLALKGYGRQRAHEHVRRIAMKAYGSKQDFVELVKSDGVIRKYIGDEVEDIFRPEKHIMVAINRAKRTIRKILEKLEKYGL